MKSISFVILCIFITVNAFAQKQTFDVISYSAPKGWQQKQNDGSVQLIATDKKSGAYIMAIITNASPSNATAIENFNSKWKTAIADQIKLDGEPTMQPSSNDNGWDIETGSTIYTDNGAKGNVALLSATGGGQTVNVVIMYNSNQYEKELAAFLNSLELVKAAQNNTGSSPANTNNTGNSSIAGLWTDYILETTGYYINGQPQYTAGYLRKEYAFYPDGTYLFRNKQWLTKTKDILFIYESGTYTINGNQLTLTPKQGKGEFWSKTSSSKEWGKLLKSSEYSLEKVTYSFEMIKDPSYGNSIVLKPGKPTQRDGGKFNAPNAPYEFHYKDRRELGSLIDNPPGLKTEFENKSFTAAATSQSKNTTTVNTVTSPLAGKIWEGTTTEKFSGGTMNGYNTGGFSTSQYKFNADGTYRFVNVLASHYTDTKSLGYETGTYTVNSDLLIINPTNGQNEEWSKVGKTSNGNSDVTNRAINETWGKKIKTSPRKLEKYTYAFSIGKNGDKTALILQRNGSTEREGDEKISYLNETSPEKSVKLPATIK